MSGEWYNKGMGAVQKAREEAKASYRPEFFLKEDGDSAKIIPLDSEPFNVYQHSVELRGRFRKYTCMRKNCPLCKVNEPRFVSIYRIIDTRSYEDKQGKTHKNEERYWEIGSKLMAQVESLDEDGNFFGQIVKVKRAGKGTKTTYAITFVGEPNKVPKATLKPVEDYAPKSRQELQTIAELLGCKDEDADYTESKSKDASRYYGDDEDEVEEKPKAKKKKPAVVIEDEEEDDEDAEDDDEPADDEDEDEDPPPPPVKKKKPVAKKVKKKPARVLEDEEDFDDDDDGTVDEDVPF
jgi:hypothetical protein